jgi:hypothetical protein
MIFLLSCIIATANAETPLLERTVTLTVTQERLDIVLKKISQLADFTFSYSPSAIEVSKLVSHSFAGNTVREVLDELLKGAAHYKVRGNYVILTRASASGEDKSTYSGYVVDESTGKRLANVSVYDPISLSSAVTDDYGYFQIEIDEPTAEEVKLAVRRLDYADTVLMVSPGRTGLLRIPLSFDEEKLETLADTVSERILRFWKTRVMKPQSANIRNISDTLFRKVQVSVLPFIGTNHTLSANVINDYSFNIFGGYSLGVQKLEVGGTFNIDRGDVRGLQLAGIFNAVGGRTEGFQAAGMINMNLDSVKGAQIAGIMNLNWNTSQQFSAAGMLNITRNDSRGAHLAGLANLAVGNQDGPHVAGLFNLSTSASRIIQLAGFFNVAASGMRGGQVAGLANYAGPSSHGVQLAGLINVAPGELRGLQLAGLINYATRVKGVQLGVINIADSVKGVPIGLLSLVRKGYHQLEVSADEIFYANIAFRTGVSHFYNIFSAGAKPSTFKDDEPYWTFGYGFGTAPRLSRTLSLNVDITANHVGRGEKIDALSLLNKLYVGVEFHPLKKLGVIAGVTLNYYVTDDITAQFPDLFTNYNPEMLYERTYSDDMSVRMWMGGKIGLRLL